MAVARLEHFGKLLEPGLRKIFYGELAEIPSLIPEVFTVQQTSNPYEEDLLVGAMGIFPKFTGTVTYDRPYQGYSVKYEFPEYADGFPIERKLYDDDRYNIINRRPKEMALAYARRREMDAFTLLNYAHTTSAVDPEGTAFTLVGGDGKALCATDHPSPAPGGPAARSNQTTLTLNHANLQTVKNMMRRSVDDRNNKIALVPDTIIVGIDNEEMGYELIESPKKINTADNNPNIHYGRYKLIVADYLTEDGRWFLMDSKYQKMYLNWFDRVPIEFAQTEEFDELVAKFRGYARHGLGWSNWLGVIGNFPHLA